MKRLGGGYKVTALILDFVFLLTLLLYGAALFYVLTQILSTKGLNLVGGEITRISYQYVYFIFGTILVIAVIFVILIIVVLCLISTVQDMKVIRLADDIKCIPLFRKASLTRSICSLVILYISNMISSPSMMQIIYAVIFIVSFVFVLKANKLLK